MKKRIIIITAILIILIIAILVFITYFKNDYSGVNVDTKDIMNKISVSLGSDIPPMMLLDEQQVIDTYDIDISKVENYVINIPIMNIRADEIAIIKVKNINDVEYIKNKLNDRLLTIQSTFERYLQDQFELSKAPLIIVRGKYILMSISENNDKIETAFESYFIKK